MQRRSKLIETHLLTYSIWHYMYNSLYAIKGYFSVVSQSFHGGGFSNSQAIVAFVSTRPT